jgi:Anti-sigma factor NepR
MNDEKKDAARRRPVGNRTSDSMSGSQSEKAPAKDKAPPAQDRWFDTQLGRMYADLATEPLPKEMMALLEKLKNAKP